MCQQGLCGQHTPHYLLYPLEEAVPRLPMSCGLIWSGLQFFRVSDVGLSLGFLPNTEMIIEMFLLLLSSAHTETRPFPFHCTLELQVHGRSGGDRARTDDSQLTQVMFQTMTLCSTGKVGDIWNDDVCLPKLPFHGMGPRSPGGAEHLPAHGNGCFALLCLRPRLLLSLLNFLYLNCELCHFYPFNSPHDPAGRGVSEWPQM